MRWPGRPSLGELRADCAHCDALCCVAPGLSKSADFAIDKPAGEPCPNLDGRNRCRIHSGLRDLGFGGCSAFDCFGAGQHASRSIRSGGESDTLGIFGAVLRLKEMQWYLVESSERLPPGELSNRVAAAGSQVDSLLAGSPTTLSTVDLSDLHDGIGELLSDVSSELRHAQRTAPVRYRGADLAGANLAGKDLRAAELRGASLLGADLRAAQLSHADFLGADLRGADVRGANLEGALFLTRTQIGAAQGNQVTVLSLHLERPGHWG